METVYIIANFHVGGKLSYPVSKDGACPQQSVKWLKDPETATGRMWVSVCKLGDYR
jgi:hypothetical protein